MLETLFTYRKVLARHYAGPAVAERERYLAHCAEQGMAHATLAAKADELLVVAERFDVATSRPISALEIEVAAEKWVRHQRRRRRIDNGWSSRVRFIQLATAWLGFIGRLASPCAAQNAFQREIDDFAAFQSEDRGLSAATISAQRWQVATFLQHFADHRASIALLRISDIDAYLDEKGRHGWCRVSVATCAGALRSFLRHAEMRGWCADGIATAVDAPRLFKQEGLPRGPRWDDVCRLIAASDGDDARDIRDHAILMLLAIYGLRSGEVRNLCLGDLNWTSDLITITRSKQRRVQIYPLVASVGNAVLRYLQEVRPTCRSRALFVTLKAPIGPLSSGGLHYIVRSRLNALGVESAHRGPHGLRHACATHLVGEGLSLKEIGDHLGHSSAFATRTYAKVDLKGLREVAAFSLGDLS